MGLKCKIKEINGIKVPIKDGSIDPLYKSLLEYYKDENTALTSWALSNSIESIEELQPFEGSSVEVSLAKFLTEGLGNEEINVSEEEKSGILYLALSQGYSSLSSFSDFLNRTFKPSGYFNFSNQNLLASGLFTITEIENVQTEKIVEVVNKTESLLSRGFDPILQEQIKTDLVDTDTLDILGTSKKMTVADALLKLKEHAANNYLELDEAVEDLGFENLRQYIDPEKFDNLTLIQELGVENGELTLNINQSRKVLENTLLDYTDTVDLEADIDFIAAIDNDVWASKQDAVKSMVKEIEENLATKGVDIIGLSETGLLKEELTLFLRTVQNMLSAPNKQTVDAFYDQLSILNLKDDTGSNTLTKIFANDPNLDLVEVNSDLSLTDLYKNFGLVKFRDNLFFKVQKESKDILYEKLYTKYTQSGEGIENNSQKSDVLQGLTALVNTYRSGVDEDIREEYTLYKLLSGKATTEELRVKDTSVLTNIETDVEYLKGEFLSDFNKYILKEKLKKSESYQNVLKRIKITDAGIVFSDDLKTLDGIDYHKELLDYIKISRSNSGNRFLKPVDMSYRDRDLYYLNNKNKIREVQTEYKTSGEFLATRNNPNLYVRVGKQIYRKAVSKDGNDLYAKVRDNYKDNLYLDSDNNYDTDIQEMFDILNRLKLTPISYQKQDLQTSENYLDNLAILDSGIEFQKQTNKEKIENCG